MDETNRQKQAKWMQSLAKIRSMASEEEIRDAVNKSVFTAETCKKVARIGGWVEVWERARRWDEQSMGAAGWVRLG